MYAFIHSTVGIKSSDECQILFTSLETKQGTKPKSCPSGTSILLGEIDNSQASKDIVSSKNE